MFKKILLASLVAGSLGSVTVASSAAVVVVREAPPALRVEHTPQARRGYTWVAGHWDWRRNHYTWVKGTWVRDRHGYVYQQPSWEERDGRWHMKAGAWQRGQRDRDGDGVPNRVDDHPNNPNRN
ncbi:MAG: YXWGXW repeat-containing protein [Massilia sp.]